MYLRWIAKDANTCRDDLILWYITHHPRKRPDVSQFLFIHPWHIIGVLCGQYDGYDPLAWLLVQC